MASTATTSPAPAPIAVSVAEAARLVGISRAHLYSLIARGEGPPAAMVGGRRLYRVVDLDAWLATLATRSGDA